MSTVERKEYQETRILRSRSPVRTVRSSNQNLAQFDSNLGIIDVWQPIIELAFNFLCTDNLLEDLQNSVSRPGSSLGQNATSSYKETSKYISSGTDGYGKTNSLNRVTNLKPSNPVTEYSSDDAYTYTVRKLICDTVRSYFSVLVRVTPVGTIKNFIVENFEC